MTFWRRKSAGAEEARRSAAERDVSRSNEGHAVGEAVASLAVPRIASDRVALGHEYVPWESLGDISAAWRIADGATGSPFDPYRGKFLPLPDWYDSALDPLSPEYLAQQDRIWRLMIGSEAEYQPDRDEQTGVDESQTLVRPGFYSSPPEQAGDHIIAMGHILRVCGLKSGDRVLEYGAGFGQIALTLARLGLIVDTVDIDPGFCSAVNRQAKWFNVDLTAHHGQFGDNPTGHGYDMILFYEAFHHARDFQSVISEARSMLKPGGKIVMAGEPIQPNADGVFAKACPYPWGMRLDIENAAIVRFRHWYELGFREEFLFDLFNAAGFTPRKFPGHISACATVYTFTMRGNVTLLSEWSHNASIVETWWTPEPMGRWTRDVSLFPIETGSNWSKLRVACANYHAKSQLVDFQLGAVTCQLRVPGGQDGEVIVLRDSVANILQIKATPIVPRTLGVPDDRPLGIFVKSVEYLE